jgi:hypothetical protein
MMANILGASTNGNGDVAEVCLAKRGPRQETGVFAFEHDWPGIFIRGDEAMKYADAITICERIGNFEAWPGSLMGALRDLLSSCKVA